MKINEKNLSVYASFTEGIVKEGFLDKKGEVNHGYKKRWFVLKGNLLFYFEKPGEKQPLGVIIVENCSVEICDLDRYSFSVRFQDIEGATSSSSRTYILCAESEVEMEKWMKAISSSSYNYSEIVVKEFEKTLDRLKSETENFRVAKSKNEEKTSTASATVPSASNLPKSKSVKLRYNTHDKSRQTKETMTMSSLSVEQPKRSKSSENIHKLQISKSPQILRKGKSGLSSYEALPVDHDDSGKSTFEELHSQFGAAIWTKVLS